MRYCLCCFSQTTPEQQLEYILRELEYLKRIRNNSSKGFHVNILHKTYVELVMSFITEVILRLFASHGLKQWLSLMHVAF